MHFILLIRKFSLHSHITDRPSAWKVHSLLDAAINRTVSPRQRTDGSSVQRGSAMPRKVVQTHVGLSAVFICHLIRISTPLMVLTLYHPFQPMKCHACKANIWEEK